jgi:hypothetical protein
MKSLGIKDGREWVQIEAEAQDVEGSGSIPTPSAIVGFARARGFDAKRWGECPEDGWIWIQGPRL